MTKKEKFEVSVAAFEALLGKNNLWREYFATFNRVRLSGNSREIYSDWKAWAMITPSYEWCSAAFRWDGTNQGNSIWGSLDYEWLLWICKNLNK